MKKPNGEVFATLFCEKRKQIKGEKRTCLRNYISSIEPMKPSSSGSFCGICFKCIRKLPERN